MLELFEAVLKIIGTTFAIAMNMLFYGGLVLGLTGIAAAIFFIRRGDTQDE